MSIKIFHWAVSDDNSVNENVSYAVTEVDGDVTLTFKIPFRGNAVERSYTFNVEESKETVRDVFVTETNEHSALLVVDAFTYCNRNGYNTNAFNRQKAARIIVDDAGDVYFMLTHTCEDLDGFENVSMVQAEYTAAYYLRQACAWYDELLDARSKKQALIRETDPYASISYLEAQVDLLTKIVLSLTTDEAVADYVTALGEADNYSVLNIKSLENVKAEFTDNKAAFRALQEAYYEQIND